MAVGAFPRFLLSDAFKEWRQYETEVAQAMIEAQSKDHDLEGGGKKDIMVGMLYNSV